MFFKWVKLIGIAHFAKRKISVLLHVGQHFFWPLFFLPMIWQKEIEIKPRSRGIHLITPEIEQAIQDLHESGVLHVFILHSSAGLTINENADPTVRSDMNAFLDRLVQEDEPWYQHCLEGSDDMPAHIKSMLTGNSLLVPVTQGKLRLGIWQGIYLCEFRNHAGPRRLVLSLLS